MPKLLLYHAAPKAFERFRPGQLGSVGIHLGTRTQALARARHAGFADTGVLLTVHAEVSNPLRLPDLYEWRPWLLWEAMAKQLPDLKGMSACFPATAASQRRFILSLGFDAIVYLNRFEGVRSDASSVGMHDHLYGHRALTDAAFRRRFPVARDSLLVLDRNRLEIRDCKPLCALGPARPRRTPR